MHLSFVLVKQVKTSWRRCIKPVSGVEKLVEKRQLKRVDAILGLCNSSLKKKKCQVMGANFSPEARKMAAAVVPSFPESHLFKEEKQADR